MDEAHKLILQKNFATLVHNTNIRELLPRLIERQVFSQRIVEPYTNENLTESDRKRKLFLDIQRRGPNAFDSLVASLKDINDYDHRILASLLEGKEVPNYNKNEQKTQRHSNYNLKLQKQSAIIDEEQSLEELDESNFTSTSSATGAAPYKLPDNQKPNHIRQVSQESPYANIYLNDEPLKVQVKMSTEFFDDQSISKIPMYSMRSKCRGAYLAINNMEFINNVHNYREGAEVDEENLKDLFKQMGFSISSYRNQTNMDMRKTIRDFASYKTNPILRQADCLVIAIMSHGEEGDTQESSHVITSDAKYLSVSWILEQFDNHNCPEFQNKPKIFIFQICRGADLHLGVPLYRRIETDGVNNTKGHKIRDMTDMLIAFSTLPGDQSFRDTELGTWYIQLICEVFMRHAYDTDVEHLLKIVDEKLKDLCTKDGNMQVSSYESRAFKRCYFHPGLYQ